MLRGRVLAGALAVVAAGLSSTGLKADPPAQGNPACATVTKDLEGQIETIKELKAQSSDSLLDFAQKPGKSGKHEDAQGVLLREREQADALNAMLPGMGCPRLDIDDALTKPVNHALLPAAPPKTKKHQKH